MNVPHQTINIDVNSRTSQNVYLICNTNDSGTRFVDVNLLADSEPLDVSGNTVTAAIVTDGFLVSGEIGCSVNKNVVTVPIDNTDASCSGIMLVELKITSDDNKVLSTPIAFKVRVTKSITENANVTEKSVGTVADVIKEVAAAKGKFKSLAEALASKADKATTIAGYGITDAITNTNDSVKTQNIANGAVASRHIANGAVKFYHIEDEAINVNKLGGESVTMPKLAGDTLKTFADANEGKTTFALYSKFFRGQVNGGTTSSGTINRNIKYRVTSEDIMKFDYDLNVSVDEGFTGYLVEYENGVCKNNPPTKSLANYNNIIPAGTEFRLHIRRTNEIPSETADINEFVNAVKFQTKTASEIAKANQDISEIGNNLKATDNALVGELPLKWLQGNVPPLGGGAGNRIIAVLGLMTQPFTISWTDENRVVKVWGYDSDTYDNRTKEISVSSGDTITPVQNVYYVIVTRTEDSAVIKPAYGDNVMVNVAFQKIKELDGRIKTIEDKLTDQLADEIPDYYYENNYLPNKIDEIKNACSILHGVTFAFITDMHFKANQGQSKKLLKKILDETNIPFVICGGDIVYLEGTEEELHEQVAEFNSFKSYIGKDRLFCTRGNHDLYNATNPSSETDRVEHCLKTSDVYDNLFRDNERSVTSMSVNNGCYCIDNEPQKTRIIMLNTSDMSDNPDNLGGGISFRSSTLKWLADVLNEKKNYKIIIVCHHHINDDFVDSAGNEIKYDFKYPDGTRNTSLMGLVSSFVDKDEFITEQNGVPVSVNFADNTNELVCVLSGHRHMDLVSTKSGILNIVTTCDCVDSKDGYGRKAGTISEQAFDVVCVNYDTKKINTVRIGAGSSREFTY